MKKQKANKNIPEKVRGNSATTENTITGVIAGIMNGQVRVLTEGGIVTCPIPGSFSGRGHALAVGDRAELTGSGSRYSLAQILPRETILYRGDRRAAGESIPVAANVRCLLAVVTADYLLNQAGYPEAAAIAAGRAGIQACLFVSKWDLAGERARAALDKRLALYRKTFAHVCAGAEENSLLPFLKGKTTVVTGDRGGGKTALIQRLTGGVSKGGATHTPVPGTHTSTLCSGPEGVFLIDTPGFRDFALQGITGEERDAVFPEIAGPAAGCRFRDCSHTHEEGCRVREAVRTKEVQQERYRAYLTMGAVPDGAPRRDSRHESCADSFTCKACGAHVVPEGAGSRHRNHCPSCLSSIHVDEEPGDRASPCKGVMDPVSVWVRKGGEWAIIHRCRTCGAFSSNRIAADDNPILLLSIAVRPLSAPPFPLSGLERINGQ